jgi:hypothetical protein
MTGTHQDSNSLDFHGNTSWQDSDWEEIASLWEFPASSTSAVCQSVSLYLVQRQTPEMDCYRKSMWEIHPITRIEVWKNDKWVDLDKL